MNGLVVAGKDVGIPVAFRNVVFPAAPTADSAKTAAPNGPASPQWTLKTVVKVGLLSKGLLLKEDRVVQLVALCSKPYRLINCWIELSTRLYQPTSL
uniref:Uncharacterized protein n=1 Tax=Daphnia galeata TaxID=27404 RepID=A0A8J2RNE9_9CRUS|nr:unnamed protein product [Daphnia galeata]